MYQLMTIQLIFDKGNFCRAIKILSPLASCSLLVNFYRPVAHMVTSQCASFTEYAIEDTRETNGEPVINLANTCGIYLVICTYCYSKLTKLLNVALHVHRFCHNLNHPLDKITGPITAKELPDSTMLWIKASQQQECFEEINLTSKLAKHTLLVCQLRLFLDSRGFLHCGGGSIMRLSASWQSFLIYCLPNTRSPSFLCMPLMRDFIMQERVVR